MEVRCESPVFASQVFFLLNWIILGNLCLNVGISADGKVPNIQAERLLAIGSWLNVTGEAIYNTTKYKTPEVSLVHCAS